MQAATPSHPNTRRWKLVATVATLLALFFATKDSFHQQALGLHVTWGKNLWWKAMEWYAWALFSPLIFRICARWDFTERPWRTVGIQLIYGVAASLLHCVVLTTGARLEAQILQTGLSWPTLFIFILTNHFHEDALTYGAIVSVWYALDHYARFRERERRASELEARLAQARLHALQMQLHPHFLFNTLNGIAALNYEDPKAANRMLARLSELLRMSLERDGAQEVSLRSELDFIRRYLELEQIRLGDRMKVELAIAPETLDACVPSLILQPLVENAIRHGIAPFSAAGQLRVRAYREQDRLHLDVQDSGPGLSEMRTNGDRPTVGLNNTRARLEALYRGAHRFTLKNGERGGLIAELVIPFRLAASQEENLVDDYENSHLNRG
jgi:sensor histidine kinase YesM